MELEYFVHGAMCMAYSGRCILSKWMLNRSANLGDCTQPCRWAYRESPEFGKFLVPPKAGRRHFSASASPWRSLHLPGEVNSARCSVSPRASHKRQTPNYNDNQDYTLITRIVDDKKRFEIEIEEDAQGTYLFNSNDICLIEYLDELQKAGITSFKIEGRNKSAYYVAMVVRAYREVLKALRGAKPKQLEDVIEKQKIELEKLSNRGFWTGFAFQDEPPHLFEKASNSVSDEFAGISLIEDDLIKSSERRVFVHNSFVLSDKLEVITPEEIFKVEVLKIRENNKLNEDLNSAHGGQNKIFRIKFNKEIPGVFILRKKLL
jgi:putative protease